MCEGLLLNKVTVSCLPRPGKAKNLGSNKKIKKATARNAKKKALNRFHTQKTKKGHPIKGKTRESSSFVWSTQRGIEPLT